MPFVVDGIILVLSCRKFKSRVDKLKIPECTYATVVVVGDQSIEAEYILSRSRRSGRFYLTLWCEDTYIYLFKKLVLAIDAIGECFDIREGGGILRMCDDIVFQYTLDNLFNIASTQKLDVMGVLIDRQFEPDEKVAIGCMVEYYKAHPNELVELRDKDGGLVSMEFIEEITYKVPPLITVVVGHMMYLSVRFAKFMSYHFHQFAKLDVFHRVGEGETRFRNAVGTYPFFVEDAAISYCMALDPGCKIVYYPMTDIRSFYLARTTNEHWAFDPMREI